MFRQAVPLAAFLSRGGGPAPTKGTLGGGRNRRGAGPQVSAGANWEFRQPCCHQSLLKMSVMVQSANEEVAWGGGVGWGGLRLQGGRREGSAVGRQHPAWLCCDEPWASCGDAFACKRGRTWPRGRLGLWWAAAQLSQHTGLGRNVGCCVVPWHFQRWLQALMHHAGARERLGEATAERCLLPRTQQACG